MFLMMAIVIPGCNFLEDWQQYGRTLNKRDYKIDLTPQAPLYYLLSMHFNNPLSFQTEEIIK